MPHLLPQRRARVVYRSVFRLVVWVPAALVTGVAAVGAGLTGDPAALLLLPLAAFILGITVWPRMVLDRDGLQVRNRGTVVIPWVEVRGAGVEPQVDHLGRFWRLLSWGAYVPGAEDESSLRGFPGLVIRTRTLGTFAALAVQRAPFRTTGFPDRVGVAVEAAHRAACSHQDPVAAARTAASRQNVHDA